jgi:hypothetical protein
MSAQRWEAPDPDALWKAAGPPVEDAADQDEAGAAVFAAYDGVDVS